MSPPDIHVPAEVTTCYYINEYLTNRAYGGPEEGGWYYETGTFVCCHDTHPTLDEAHDVLDALTPDLARRRKDLHDPGSVLCTGWPDIYIQRFPGADYPVLKPHYE